MATVNGITAERALAIEDASVVSGTIDVSTGHLILTTGAGTVIDAGVARPDAAIAAAVLVETNNRIADVNQEVVDRNAAISVETADRVAAIDTLVDDTGTISSLTGFTLASGWNTASVRYRVIKIGSLEIVELYINVNRSGAPISNTSSGNLGNVSIFSASPSAIHPSASSVAIGGPGSGAGRLVGVTVTSAGVIALGAIGGTSDFATSENLTAIGVYFK
jgi:hypothetical protein